MRLDDRFRFLIIFSAALLSTAMALGGDLAVDLRRQGGEERPDSLRPAASNALVAEFFLDDPTLSSRSVIAGDATARLTYAHDRPAFPGDRPGSLTARYDATLASGLFGIRLPESLDQDRSFTLGAVLIVRSEGFSADPNGFFQISWGAWNGNTTGLERTGDFSDFSTDCFELLEFDYFPNVSPFFGGPYLSPSHFGVADPANPAFPSAGAFANAAFAFGPQVEMPLDTPLLAMIEHQPALDAAVVSLHRIVGARRTLPVDGAVAVVDLGQLAVREYTLDAIGPTLWRDGFSGPTPSVLADVTFHALIAIDGPVDRPADLLRAAPAHNR